jgi:hypothetical protein
MPDALSFADAQQRMSQGSAAGLIGRYLEPEPIVHLFEGAPRNEEKRAPCGVEVVRQGRFAGFVLTGVHATTAVDYVTCIGCLRALIPKGK